MKTLMIEYFLPGSTYSAELCAELQKNAEVTLLCPSTVKHLPQIQHYRPVLYATGKSKPVAMLAYGRSLLVLFCELMKNYDVVHIQTMKAVQIETPLYMIAKKIKRRHPWKLVYTVHNILPHERMKNERERFERIYHICDALIVHNEYCKRLLTTEYDIPESKVTVIPHGTYADLRKLPEAERSPRMNVLFFGAMKPYKGLDVLLNAISLLSEEDRQKMNFIIAGDPTHADRDYVALARKLQIEKSIAWISRSVEYEELPALFQRADVCIFPYREIYGSGALMMAYTFDKPVIVSDLPAFVEETDNSQTGLLFQTENPASLAEQMVKFSMLSEEQISVLRTRVHQLVKTKYNWALSAKKTKALYDSLCADRKR